MRFSSTAGGAVEQGRRRMRAFLLFLGLLCFAVAVVAGFVRIMPAVLAAVAAGSLALYARRMSADLDPLWLEIEDGCLKIQMRRQHRLVPLEEGRPEAPAGRRDRAPHSARYKREGYRRHRRFRLAPAR